MIFNVDRYLKDDESEFNGYLICEYDEVPQGYNVRVQ